MFLSPDNGPLLYKQTVQSYALSFLRLKKSTVDVGKIGGQAKHLLRRTSKGLEDEVPQQSPRAERWWGYRGEKTWTPTPGRDV